MLRADIEKFMKQNDMQNIVLMYDENCKCTDKQTGKRTDGLGYTGSGDTKITGFKNQGWNEIAPILYGKYKVTATSTGSSGDDAAYNKTKKLCPDGVDNGRKYKDGNKHAGRYCYCRHWSHSSFKGKIGIVSTPGGTGCKGCGGSRNRNSILIHGSPDNSYASENNSAGCIVLGTGIANEGDHKYLTGSHDAVFKLYDNFIWPVIANGGSVDLEIPFPQSMSKCANGFTF
jgi:hypothetical protein